MKKISCFLFFVFISFNFCSAQEWFTSFDVAKRLALTQDKMLFVMWQNTLDYAYPVKLIGDNGVAVVVDLNEDDDVNKLIWEYFVPVILLESNYEEYYNEAKKIKNVLYLDKLKDDSIKIMDVNGNILNIKSNYLDVENLSLLLKKYALNTSFLKHEITNYSKEENVTTAFNLASKYLDYSIYVQKDVRGEIIELANIYFEEAHSLLAESDINNKSGFSQRLELLDIEKLLVLNNPDKVRRLLKRIDEEEIDPTNYFLFCFLNYTTFKLLKDDKKAVLWKDKLSPVDLKKAEVIINNNL